MGTPVIRIAGEGDIALVDQALRALSADLGDTHVAGADRLRSAGFGRPAGPFVAALALRQGAAVGVALFTPVFSTTLGGPGAYVSDLWVAGGERGNGLGRRLLATAGGEAAARWNAAFIRLSVYSGNRRAIAFYEGLGFARRDGETGLILSGADFTRLGGGYEGIS